MTTAEAFHHIAQHAEHQVEEPLPETMHVLAALHEVLDAQDYNSFYSEPEAASPLPKLHIAVGRMDPHLLIARFVSLADIEILNGAAAPEEPEPEVVQGSLILPFAAAAGRIGELARAVLYVNRLLSQCAFGISDAEGTCYLQTTFAIEPGTTLPVASVLALVDLMSFAAQTYGPLLAQVAAGARDFAGLTRHLAEMGLQPQPVQLARHLADPEADDEAE